MEAIIVVVGFLGAGKTTVLKQLTSNFKSKNWSPFIILNDYENAHIDAQQFEEIMGAEWVQALNGSCICCSGIHLLRDFVNDIPKRENGITLIEANGTSDACALMGFLGVGIHERFLPPIQISVVDVKNWQKRGEHNGLEINQIQVSPLIVLTHLENATEERKVAVIADLKTHNPFAKIVEVDDLHAMLLPTLEQPNNQAEKLENYKKYWSSCGAWASCSVDLPPLPNKQAIHNICENLPKSILRVKGTTQIGEEENYTYFERTPDGEVAIRPFNGIPKTGAKLLTIGPGSEVSLLEKVIENSLIEVVA